MTRKCEPVDHADCIREFRQSKFVAESKRKVDDHREISWPYALQQFAIQMCPDCSSGPRVAKIEGAGATANKSEAYQRITGTRKSAVACGGHTVAILRIGQIQKSIRAVPPKAPTVGLHGSERRKVVDVDRSSATCVAVDLIRHGSTGKTDCTATKSSVERTLPWSQIQIRNGFHRTCMNHNIHVR